MSLLVLFGGTGTPSVGTDPPEVETGAAENFGAGSAVLAGTVDPNGHGTTYWFEWGPTTDYGNVSMAQSAGSGADPVEVSLTITGLEAGTGYHYRIVATNSFGTSYGGDRGFTMASPPPAFMLCQGERIAAFWRELYAALAPLAYQDRELGYPLRSFLQSIAKPFELIECLARDHDDGPGWSAIMDVDRAPASFLPWLARFNGTRPTVGAPDPQVRAEIRDAAGFRRGTRASIEAAAKLTLTGDKRTKVRERDGDAYALTVITYRAETPSYDAVRESILKVKPAGLLLTVSPETGNTYRDLRDGEGGRTYTEVVGEFATYDDARAAIPL